MRVVSNIAEGFEQKTDRNFARYLYDARGGTGEIRTQLSIAFGRGHISATECQEWTDIYAEIARMLSGLIDRLERDDRVHRRKAVLE